MFKIYTKYTNKQPIKLNILNAEEERKRYMDAQWTCT